jgi:hypothetical protein
MTSNNVDTPNYDTYTAVIYTVDSGWVDVRDEGGTIFKVKEGDTTVKITFRPPHYSQYAVAGSTGTSSSGSSGGGSSSADGGSCLIERSGVPSGVIADLRHTRDLLMDTSFGRFLTESYYEWFEAE